jgi:hypothetical protein
MGRAEQTETPSRLSKTIQSLQYSFNVYYRPHILVSSKSDRIIRLTLTRYRSWPAPAEGGSKRLSETSMITHTESISFRTVHFFSDSPFLFGQSISFRTVHFFSDSPFLFGQSISFRTVHFFSDSPLLSWWCRNRGGRSDGVSVISSFCYRYATDSKCRLPESHGLGVSNGAVFESFAPILRN